MGIAIDCGLGLLAGHLDGLAEASLEELGEPGGRVLAGRRLSGRTKGRARSRSCRLGRRCRGCELRRGSGAGSKRRLRSRGRDRRLHRSGKRGLRGKD